MACNLKNPPKLEDDSAYESWRKDINIWTDLTELPKGKQALAIHLSLSGRARSASSEIDADSLKKDDGVQTLLNKLDNLFLADKGRRQFAAFHRLYNFRRADSVDVGKFICEFEHIYFKFTEQNMTLPDSVQAFMLLAACNFSETERKLAMSAITDVSYNNMKAALKRIFATEISAKEKDSSNSFDFKTEPVFQSTDCDDSEVFYTNRGRSLNRGGRRAGRFGTSAYRGVNARQRGAYRTSGNNNANRQPVQGQGHSGRKMNPMSSNGKISRCLVCESKFHWARDCPDAFENKEEAKSNDIYNEEENDEIVHMTLFVGYANATTAQSAKLQSLISESHGHVVLDTGCSSTVCGSKWYETYVNELSEYDQSKIVENYSASTFTFGDGIMVQSLKKVVLPCYLGGDRSTITADVVECDIPMLLSKRSMKKANMCLNFRDDTVKIGNHIIQLVSSTSGHYLLPITL